MDPETLLVTSFNRTIRLVSGRYLPRPEGLVNRSQSLGLPALTALPQQERITRHLAPELITVERH